MSGTTTCPHCEARFRITKAQMVAHHGMVRCGFCKEAFDTRPNFVPDQLDLQFDLPLLDEPVLSDSSKITVLQPMTLAEQVAIISDDEAGEFQRKPRSWPWAVAALLLMLLLVAQAIYYFRADIAARLPDMKPLLSTSCRILKCTVPLPRNVDLIGIESSDLEADPVNKNQITLNALLRNRAPYAQAFPDMELTLNDLYDQPLARRVFRPADYLPPQENETAGISPNNEISIKLHLNTANLKPLGYRLVLLYQAH